MAFDPHEGLAADADASDAPRLLRRPTEAPPRLGRIADGRALQALRHEWLLHDVRRRALWSGSLRNTARLWAGRLTGRSRRRLTDALADATIELADRCEVLTDRMMSEEEVTGEVATAFGEELSRLRSEVLHLTRLVAELSERTHA